MPSMAVRPSVRRSAVLGAEALMDGRSTGCPAGKPCSPSSVGPAAADAAARRLKSTASAVNSQLLRLCRRAAAPPPPPSTSTASRRKHSDPPYIEGDLRSPRSSIRPPKHCSGSNLSKFSLSPLLCACYCFVCVIYSFIWVHWAHSMGP